MKRWILAAAPALLAAACPPRGALGPVGVSMPAGPAPALDAGAAQGAALTDPSPADAGSATDAGDAAGDATARAWATPDLRIPVNRPGSVAVDASFVFFLADDCVKRADKTGQAATDLYCSPKRSRARLHELALDAGHVYVARTPREGLGEVLQIPKAGGAARRITETRGAARGLVSDGQSVFWAVGEGLFRAPVAAGGPTLIQHLEGGLRGLALLGGDLYFAKAHHLDEVVRRMPKAGGVVYLAVDERWSLLAAHGDMLFGADPPRRKLLAHPVEIPGVPRTAPETPATVLARTDVAIDAIAADAAHVYWIGHPGLGCSATAQGALWRVPRGGGASEVVGGDLRCPVGFALDDAHVWVSLIDRASCPTLRAEAGVPGVVDDHDCEIVGMIARLDRSHVRP